MDGDLVKILIVIVANIAASFISGMAGGGGGFIIGPLLIFLGLTPQQMIATGKVGSLGIAAGSISAFRGRLLAHKRFLAGMIVLSIIIGITASVVFQNLDNKTLQIIIGVMMIVLTPYILFGKSKIKHAKITKLKQFLGVPVASLVLFLQGIMGSGTGSLMLPVMMFFFGKSALESNMLKRTTAAVLNIVIVVSVLGSGLIQYKFAVALIISGFIGGYFGSHFAIKNGESFARYALAGFMIVSGLGLLISA